MLFWTRLGLTFGAAHFQDSWLSAILVSEMVTVAPPVISLRRRPSEIILPEIISKLFQRLIAADKYFPTRSMSLK